MKFLAIIALITKIFMRTLLRCFLSFFILTLVHTAKAQNTEDPGAYMTSLSEPLTEMNKTYLQYVSAAAHGRRARKLEKMRAQVLEKISNTQSKVMDLPNYKTDKTLRQSTIDYLKLLYAVFNDDYGKLVNIEEIAEQSIDEMQAYLLLKEKTAERLNKGYETLAMAQKGFAATHKVQLIETQTELGDKMSKASAVSNYADDIYIQFFKCNWQDSKVVEAMNKSKVNEVEQARNALLMYANEGLAVLDTMKSFNGDEMLKNACRTALMGYKQMAEKLYPKAAEFYLANEKFTKLKSNMDAMGNSRTKQDVDAYNAAVKTINQQNGAYNQMNAEANAQRSAAIDLYNKANSSFNDKHTPHYN